MDVPDKFRPAFVALQSLEQHEEYLGVFIFGSGARGELTDTSDVDAIVVTRADQECGNISHPIIGGVKLDISFLSVDQLVARANREANDGRVPMVAEAHILFDKEGRLERLQLMASFFVPPGMSAEEKHNIHYFLYHADEKVVQNVERDPVTALLTMSSGLADVLKMHYQMHYRWLVSSKRMLRDLANWDPALHALVCDFLTADGVGGKFYWWSKIIDHIAASFGGRLDIENSSCDCYSCTLGLALLLDDEQ